MKKLIEIEGMRCGGCSAAVKDALEKIEEISAAEVSHEKGEAVIDLIKDVADEVIEDAVEALDFVVNEIKEI